MERKILLNLIFMFVISACAGGGFETPLTSINIDTQTTYSPPQPTRTRLDEVDVDLIDGVSKTQDLQINVNGPAAKAALQGVMTIHPVDQSAAVQVPINVEGLISPDELSAYMRPVNNEELERLGVRVGAKLMCLSRDCRHSFVDIYVTYRGQVYHHQEESANNDEMGQNPNASSEKKIKPRKPKKDPAPRDGESRPQTPVKDPDTTNEESKRESPKVADTAKKEEPVAPDDEDDESGDSDELSQGPSMADEIMTETEPEIPKGAYVGEPDKDVKILFPDVKPREKTPPPAQEKKSDSDVNNKKKDTKKDPKKDEPKKGEPKASEPPIKKDPSQAEVPVFPNSPLMATDQAVGYPVYKSKELPGRLEKATNFLKYQQDNKDVGFKIWYPNQNNYYGTSDMLSIIVMMGQYSQKNLDGYVLRVSSIAAKQGGKLPGQASHRTGIDADIGYYFKNPNRISRLGYALAGSNVSQEWLSEEQWDLFKHVVSTRNVDRIFVGPKIKQALCQIAEKKGELRGGKAEGIAHETLKTLIPWDDHYDHFHLRLKCSKAQPRCRESEEPVNVTGCK